MSKQEHDEIKLRNEWMNEARKQTADTLPAFIAKLSAFPHDYGTICRAIAAAAIGAAWAVERSPRGGITGFQAGCVSWDFLAAWNRWPDDGLGHRLVDFDDLLYPQMAERFACIPREVAEKLKARAEKKLAENDGLADSRVVDHWKALAAGALPFGLRVEP